MGESNRFFTWLWRFNAILLALVGMGALVMVAIGLMNLANSIFSNPPSRDLPAENLLATHHAEKSNVTYELSGPTASAGTGYALLNLQRWTGSAPRNELRLSSGDFRGGNAVNILAIDGTTARGHWLFKGVDRILGSAGSDPLTMIDSAEPLMEIPSAPYPNGPIAAVVIEAAAAHVDKDDSFVASGPEDLYFYRFDGNEAVKFFSANRIRSTVQVGVDRLLVMYENGRSMESAVFSTRDFKLISQSPVPPVSK